MKPIKFEEHNIVIAEHQDEYLSLPAHRTKESVTFCWQLTLRERFKLLLTGKIWHSVLVGVGQPLQPQLIEVEKPDMSNTK